MSHLGRWLSALVDGELDDTERDRVLNHLAGCRSCLAEANEVRALKRRLTALGDTQAQADITDRLIDLAQCDLAQRDHDSLADRLRPASGWPSPQAGSAIRRAFQARQMTGIGSWRMATGAAGSALAAIGFVAFLLGSAQPGSPVPKITPAVDAYWSQHGYDTDQEPVTTMRPATSVTPADPASPGPAFPPVGHQVGSAISVRPDPLTSVLATPAALTPPPSSKPPGARAAHRAR